MKPWLQRVTGFFPRNRLAGAEKSVCTQRLQSRSCSCVIVQQPLSYCLPSVSSQQFLCLATALSNYLSDVCLSVQVSLLRLPLSVQPSVYASVCTAIRLCVCLFSRLLVSVQPFILLSFEVSISHVVCPATSLSDPPSSCSSVRPSSLKVFIVRLISLCLF